MIYSVSLLRVLLNDAGSCWGYIASVTDAGGMTGEHRSTRRQTYPSATLSTTNSHGLACDWTHSSGTTAWRLTADDLARLTFVHISFDASTNYLASLGSIKCSSHYKKPRLRCKCRRPRLPTCEHATYISWQTTTPCSSFTFKSVWEGTIQTAYQRTCQTAHM